MIITSCGIDKNDVNDDDNGEDNNNDDDDVDENLCETILL